MDRMEPASPLPKPRREMRYLLTIVLMVASSLSSGAAHAVVVTRGDIEEMVSELVSSPGDGDVNQLAT